MIPVNFALQSVFDAGRRITTKIMQVFPVLPLKTLVTRQVIRDRMEYKDHLGGIAKDELDQLDRLEGKFFVHAAVMEVRRRGKILSNDEWKSLKTSGLPKVIIRFLDSKKKEFSILERSNHGKREWELQDVDGSSKKFNFSSTVTDDHGGWRHKEQFIIDGHWSTDNISLLNSSRG